MSILERKKFNHVPSRLIRIEEYSVLLTLIHRATLIIIYLYVPFDHRGHGRKRSLATRETLFDFTSLED